MRSVLADWHKMIACVASCLALIILSTIKLGRIQLLLRFKIVLVSHEMSQNCAVIPGPVAAASPKSACLTGSPKTATEPPPMQKRRSTTALRRTSFCGGRTACGVATLEVERG